MITDPWFCAVAVPAVPQAAAIMLPLLLAMDAVGVKALFYQLACAGVFLTGVKLRWDGFR